MTRSGHGGRGSVNGARTVSAPERRDTKAVQRSVAGAKGGAVECKSGVEQDDASPAAVRDGAPRPSAPKRHTDAKHGSAKSAALREIGRRTDSAPKRPSDAEQGGVSPTAGPNRGVHTDTPAKRQGHGELVGRPLHAAVREGGRCADSAPKRVGQDEDARTAEAERSGGSAVSVPGRQRETAHACRPPKAMGGGGGAAVSPTNRQRRAAGDGRNEGKCGVPGRATCMAEPHCEAGEHRASRAPVTGRHRFTTSAAKRLQCGAGLDAVGPAERSPALERHLAVLSCFGALPGSRTRYVPVAVKREVWRRDHGCCSYVDRHSGRRCGSRYRLEIDHIVPFAPFALGGAAAPDNSRLHCRAHHRYRHAQRHDHTASVPTVAQRAPATRGAIKVHVVQE